MAVLDPRQSSSWSAGNGHLCNFDYYPWAPLGTDIATKARSASHRLSTKKVKLPVRIFRRFSR
jgi:hypothetical protein